MRISDWSSDVCSSDLEHIFDRKILAIGASLRPRDAKAAGRDRLRTRGGDRLRAPRIPDIDEDQRIAGNMQRAKFGNSVGHFVSLFKSSSLIRSEEHTSELQSLMRISYAVFCLKKKKNIYEQYTTTPRPSKLDL